MLNRAEPALARLPLAVTAQLGGRRAVLPRLRALCTLHIDAGPAGSPALVAQLAMLRELHGDIIELTSRISGLEHQMATLVAACGSSLLAEHGIGVIGAAVLLTEIGDPGRFRSESAFNRWWGGAPVAISSGEGHGRPVRHRLDLLGNRAVNSTLYIASVTQARHYEPARTYLAGKITEGHSGKEARRAHKTLLGRRIIRRMWADRRRQLAHQPPITTAA